MPIISVNNLSKRYRIGRRGRGWDGGLRHALTDLIARPFHRGKSVETDETEFWALKDVSFEVEEGEVLGIIGRNGAGKSTLLKILSRITWPTSGEVRIRGRVASLLEVGTGFHPELTGRENIYLNGSILGMTRTEVKSKFDEIVDFSEIEKFLDTPVKYYSSGMYVRLAFAVAAHLDPEILLVDEVLAVGDAGFQKKCLGKMGEVAKGGRTVLFVSHNMAAVSTLCPHALLLDNGLVIQSGKCEDIIATYCNKLEKGALSSRSAGDDTCELISATVLNAADAPVHQVTINEPFTVEMTYKIKTSNSGKVVPNFHFYGAGGICCFVTGAPGIRPMPPGQYSARCNVPAHLLNEGAYSIGVACTTWNGDHYTVNFYVPSLLPLNIRDPKIADEFNYGYMQTIPGVIRPRLNWGLKVA